MAREICVGELAFRRKAMFVMNKRKSEIVDVDISGRIFVRDRTVCSGRVEERPTYLGDYESDEEAVMALRMLFEAITNPRSSTFEMPQDRDIKAKIANLPPDIEKHSKTGRKNKGHGGS